MLKTGRLARRVLISLVVVSGLLLVEGSARLAQKAKVDVPNTAATPAKQSSQVDKMDPTEVTRGATVTVTGRNFPDKPENVAVLFDDNDKNPIPVEFSADKPGTLSFMVPYENIELGKHNVTLAFKKADGTQTQRVPALPLAGILTIYGDAGKTTPKITSINPVLAYPEKNLFSFEILGEGFSRKPFKDNVLFREGAGNIDVCWEDDPSCEKNSSKVAHGRVVSDRQIIVDRIPRSYGGSSKIGIRVGPLESAVMPVTLSTIEKEWARFISIGAFAAVFVMAFWILRNRHRADPISGESPGLVTSLLLDKETDTLSLSRLQFFLWTGAAVFGYFYLLVSRSWVQGKLEFVDVPEGLPAIILISAGTTVLAQGITAAKGPKGAGQVHPSAADLITVGGLVAPERFQFFVWTIIGVVAFVVLVVLQDPGKIQDLPKVPSGFMQLMGVSSIGYLGGKFARKAGPVIDDISAKGDLELTIRGRNLSRDAGFQIGELDLKPDKIISSDPQTPGKPEVVERDTDSGDATMAKTLKLTIKDPEPNWTPTAQLTIINPDGQKAMWPYSLTESENASEANTEDTADGCDVSVDNPTADENLPASEGGVA